MNIVPCKDGVLYHYVKKYRRRRLVTVLVLVFLLAVYAFFARPYLANAFFGSAILDEDRFASEVNEIKLPEPFELHRSESTAIASYALRATSYWQDIDYEFDVKLKNPERTDIVYTTANTDSTVEDKTMESAVLYTADIGGITTLVLAYPHHDFKDGDYTCGVFTEIPRIIEYDAAKYEGFSDDETFCEYMLDVRGISMESQFADIVICVLLLMLILYLAVKLVIQYIDPLTAPTYRSIDKYGNIADTVEKIESQLCSKVKNKKIKGEIVTENWIVSKDTFKIKVVKNHMQKH